MYLRFTIISIVQCVVLARLCGLKNRIRYVTSFDEKTKRLARVVAVRNTKNGTIVAFNTPSVERLLARSSGHWFGRNDREHALVDQWHELCSSTLDVHVALLSNAYKRKRVRDGTSTTREYDEYSETTFAAKGSAKRFLLERRSGLLNRMDEHLADHTFLVGERVSLADVTMSVSLCSLFFPSPLILSHNDAKSIYPHFWRWLLHLQFLATEEHGPPPNSAATLA